MKRRLIAKSCWVAALVLALGYPCDGQAKGYSSGGGHSYSSSSSHSSGFGGGSRSSSSGGSHSFGGGSSKTFSSGGGKSYSSGSGFSGEHKGYSSTKSYSAGSGTKFSSGSGGGKSTSPPTTAPKPSSASGSGFNFDAGAARARKEQASKSDFNRFKESQNPTPSVSGNGSRPGGNGSFGAPPPIRNSSRNYYRTTTYVPNITIIQTRPSRFYSVFSPYSYRPWVSYSDPYSSMFWWWLLDRSIDDQAWWAYHHRYDMDPARYQALMANNQQLEARVADLERQQAPRDPAYTPTGLDRDLMYSDQYVKQAYSNRPTTGGTVAFWIFAAPAAVGACAFFIWLIWFKRWQPAT